MATYKIVQERETPSFLGGLGKGISKGASTFSSTFLPALMKQKKKETETEEADERKKAHLEALEEGGFELDTSSVGEDGKITRKFKKRATAEDTFLKDPEESIKKAMLGITSAEDIGKILKIEHPEELPEGQDYNDFVIEALRKRFAGGATDEVIGRDFLSIPQAKEPTFNEAAQQATSGDITFEDLRGLFPTKLDAITKMKDQFTPVEKAEGFVTGTGSPVSNVKSLFSEKQAEISDQTQTVIDNIKNKADLDELRANADAYTKAGVQVKAILEYFGVK